MVGLRSFLRGIRQRMRDLAWKRKTRDPAPAEFISREEALLVLRDELKIALDSSPADAEESFYRVRKRLNGLQRVSSIEDKDLARLLVFAEEFFSRYSHGDPDVTEQEVEKTKSLLRRALNELQKPAPQLPEEIRRFRLLKWE